MYKRNSIKKAVVIASYVTICDHKIYLLNCLYNGKGSEMTRDIEGDSFRNQRRTCGENRHRLVETHGMEMLSVREEI